MPTEAKQAEHIVIMEIENPHRTRVCEGVNVNAGNQASNVGLLIVYVGRTMSQIEEGKRR